jgi:hypothetical protein
MTARTITSTSNAAQAALDPQQGDSSQTVKAIDRMVQLLRDEVIPRLPVQDPSMDELSADTMADDEVDDSADALSRANSLPCRKGGPTAADKAVVAKAGPKLRGKLRGNLTAERVCCARQIVAAVKARRLHHRAAVIAVTTTIVESTIRNVTFGDRDSLGLFQQRASWGSRAQRLNPTWATNAFLNAMLRKFPKNAWMKTPIGVVCQRVQVSAFPGRYQPKAPDARIVVGALWGAKASAEAFAETEAPADPNQASLQAIRRVTRILSEEVIPGLSGDHGEEGLDLDGESLGMGAEEAEPPDDEEEKPPIGDVPANVMDAFEALYGALSAEQARALADLFEAMAQALEDGNASDPPDDEEPPEDDPGTNDPGAGRPTPQRMREFA